MDKALYDRVSKWFDGQQERMKEDIVRLVRIPSISVPAGEEQREDYLEAPFGKPCRACLEEMLAIGREHGFYTENYGNKVGSIGEKDKDWDNMIGFWNHMDVVPVGENWKYEAFDPVEEGPFLIGRGARDNKGPAVGMLYVMECLRELNIPLKHQLCLFIGTDEERGMEDLEYYTRHYPVPRMSMVADSGFPVCYGEKGIMEGTLCGCLSEQILDLEGGSAGNMIPDTASAVLAHTPELAAAVAEVLKITAVPEVTVKQEEGRICISVRGKSAHSAFPEGSVNAIHGLMCFLAQIEALTEEDRQLFRKLAFFTEEYYGEHMGIGFQDKVSGRTTCAATVLKTEKGRLTLHFNIRYAITADREEMLRALERTAQDNGMVWETERDSKPNYFPREHPAVGLLTDLYNEITGSRTESFVMGGGTYARKLPRAFAYGVGGMAESEEEKEIRKRILPSGHGGAHEPDEALNMRLLTEAMKIYVMAVAALNDCGI